MEGKTENKSIPPFPGGLIGGARLFLISLFAVVLGDFIIKIFQPSDMVKNLLIFGLYLSLYFLKDQLLKRLGIKKYLTISKQPPINMLSSFLGFVLSFGLLWVIFATIVTLPI